MDEDWAGRRWFNDESIGEAVEGTEVNAPASACGGTAAEHAAGIIALVAADNRRQECGIACARMMAF